MESQSPRAWTTVRTPHRDVLVAALEARDHVVEIISIDIVRVRDIAPDDLGWLVAEVGAVVYEMSTAVER